MLNFSLNLLFVKKVLLSSAHNAGRSEWCAYFCACCQTELDGLVKSASRLITYGLLALYLTSPDNLGHPRCHPMCITIHNRICLSCRYIGVSFNIALLMDLCVGESEIKLDIPKGLARELNLGSLGSHKTCASKKGPTGKADIFSVQINTDAHNLG